jgi:hypothetical protein
MNETTSIVINLAARYAAAFGVLAINSQLNKAVITKEKNKYKVENYYNYENYFEQTTLYYGSKSLQFSAMLTGDTSSIYAPPLMMTFSREKQLIETEVNGSDNVIIERWGTKPWTIDIKGILVDIENHTYPNDQIEKLVDFFEHNSIIKAVGDQFYDKKIDSIYIKSISITPLEGFADTVQFNLTASSIKEVSFSLIKPNE